MHACSSTGAALLTLKMMHAAMGKHLTPKQSKNGAHVLCCVCTISVPRGGAGFVVLNELAASRNLFTGGVSPSPSQHHSPKAHHITHHSTNIAPAFGAAPSSMSQQRWRSVLLLLVAQLLLQASAKVIILTDENFDHHTRQGTWLIEAHSPWYALRCMIGVGPPRLQVSPL